MSDAHEVIAQIQSEYENMAKRIRENTQLMEQSQLEVDRLQQRNVSISSQIKRVEESFDTIPRQDIKATYEEAIDARTRLLTMRSQLEKLQEGQNQLEHYQDLLGQVLEALGGIDLPSQDGGAGASRQMGLAGETIVRIVQAQEQERRELANSLHDGPAQSLTNFILQAEICQRLAQVDAERANAELNNLKEAASGTFQKIRDFIFDLRPMMLDDLGLIPTLRRYAENYENKHNISINLVVAGEESRRLPRYTEVMVFRSLQSLLSVSQQHLKATEIRMTVDVDLNEIRAVVEDNGQGFDPVVDLDPNQGDHDVQALNALRERIELVEGSLGIFSADGEGSRFEVQLPIFDDQPSLS